MVEPVVDVSVAVSDRSGTTTYVAVQGALFDFPEALLRRYFGQYGQVLAVRMNVISSGRLKGVPNCNQTVTMHLRADIPSSVHLMGFYLTLFNAMQPPTCFQCELAGHQAARCTAVRVDPVNLFREENFFPLKGDGAVIVEACLCSVQMTWCRVRWPVQLCTRLSLLRVLWMVPLWFCRLVAHVFCLSVLRMLWTPFLWLQNLRAVLVVCRGSRPPAVNGRSPLWALPLGFYGSVDCVQECSFPASLGSLLSWRWKVPMICGRTRSV